MHDVTKGLTFRVNATQQLHLTPKVVRHISNYIQFNASQEEAGGQLFANFSRNLVTVVEATGPNCLDKRTRFSFLPNLGLQRREIKKFYKQGLHYIGEWHTHPEFIPAPSRLDVDSMQRAFQQNSHDLEWFLMIIRGKADSYDGWSVSMVDKTTCITMDAAPLT